MAEKKKPAAKKAAPKKSVGPAGPFAVFEYPAASWFDSLEDARAHAAELAGVRADGSAPVIAGVVGGVTGRGV